MTGYEEKNQDISDFEEEDQDFIDVDIENSSDGSEEEFDDLSGNFEELLDYEEEQDFENEEEQYYN